MEYCYKINGIKLATTNCGIKYKNRDDLLLIVFDDEASVSGVFTSSSMPAAPVLWCKKNIKNGRAKVLIVNSGNANAFTGKAGDEIVSKTIGKISNVFSCEKNEIFVSSTGVIGEVFDYNLITSKIEELRDDLNNDEKAWNKAAKAIITTDTKQKISSKICEIDREKVSLTGFAKGSGMIAPNMATMLGYIFTDANISSQALSQLLLDANEKTFNSITVDSDQSTNDTVLLFATKRVNHKIITDADDSRLCGFKDALCDLMLTLAKKIVIDGEGAKKLIEISVGGASDYNEAKNVAFAIANSPLVKTAIAGADPNWGRIAMAVGKSCKNTSPEKLTIKIGGYQITDGGAKHENYEEKVVHQYLKNSEIKIEIDLGIEQYEANKQAIVWTCDLNEEYIKINKDYRS
jgi:glutamate N-acetyltransferase/amino-acid N-acetyltransferase